MTKRHWTVVLGRLGKDPETRYKDDGKQITKFSVASDDGYGEDKKTTWYDMVAFGKTAEICSKLLVKGSHVKIECRYSGNQRYEVDGQTRYSHNFIINDMVLLGNGRQSDAADDDDAEEEFPF